jgi:hypothetical protein
MFLFLTPVFSPVDVGGTVIPNWEADLTNTDSSGSSTIPNTFSVEAYGNATYSGNHVKGTVEVSTDGKNLNIYQAYAGANFNLGNDLTGTLSAGKIANFWYQKDGGVYGVYYYLTRGSISKNLVPVNPIGASLKIYKDNTTVAVEVFNDSVSTNKQSLFSFISNYKRLSFGMFLFTTFGNGDFANSTTYGAGIGYMFVPKFGNIYLNLEANYHPFKEGDAIFPFAGYIHFTPKKFPIGLFFRYENRNFNVKNSHETTVALTANPWKEFSIAAGWKNFQPVVNNTAFITGSVRF